MIVLNNKEFCGNFMCSTLEMKFVTISEPVPTKFLVMESVCLIKCVSKSKCP